MGTARGRRARAVWAAAALGAACASSACRAWRVTGESPRIAAEEAPTEPSYEVSPDTGPARPGRLPVFRIMTDAELSEVRYYSDLGPDTIDVSAYPERQRANYALFRYACSQCHTPARAINAPMVSRRFWWLYVQGMRFRAHFEREKRLSKDDIESILDFLEFDAQERKAGRRGEFEAGQEALRERHGRLVAERLERLQKAPQPRLVPPPGE